MSVSGDTVLSSIRRGSVFPARPPPTHDPAIEADRFAIAPAALARDTPAASAGAVKPSLKPKRASRVMPPSAGATATASLLRRNGAGGGGVSVNEDEDEEYDSADEPSFEPAHGRTTVGRHTRKRSEPPESNLIYPESYYNVAPVDAVFFSTATRDPAPVQLDLTARLHAVRHTAITPTAGAAGSGSGGGGGSGGFSFENDRSPTSAAAATAAITAASASNESRRRRGLHASPSTVTLAQQLAATQHETAIAVARVRKPNAAVASETGIPLSTAATASAAVRAWYTLFDFADWTQLVSAIAKPPQRRSPTHAAASGLHSAAHAQRQSPKASTRTARASSPPAVPLATAAPVRPALPAAAATHTATLSAPISVTTTRAASPVVPPLPLPPIDAARSVGVAAAAAAAAATNEAASNDQAIADNGGDANSANSAAPAAAADADDANSSDSSDLGTDSEEEEADPLTAAPAAPAPQRRPRVKKVPLVPPAVAVRLASVQNEARIAAERAALAAAKRDRVERQRIEAQQTDSGDGRSAEKRRLQQKYTRRSPRQKQRNLKAAAAAPNATATAGSNASPKVAPETSEEFGTRLQSMLGDAENILGVTALRTAVHAAASVSSPNAAANRLRAVSTSDLPPFTDGESDVPYSPAASAVMSFRAALAAAVARSDANSDQTTALPVASHTRTTSTASALSTVSAASHATAASGADAASTAPANQPGAAPAPTLHAAAVAAGAPPISIWWDDEDPTPAPPAATEVSVESELVRALAHVLDAYHHRFVERENAIQARGVLDAGANRVRITTLFEQQLRKDIQSGALRDLVIAEIHRMRTCAPPPPDPIDSLRVNHPPPPAPILPIFNYLTRLQRQHTQYHRNRLQEKIETARSTTATAGSAGGSAFPFLTASRPASVSAASATAANSEFTPRPNAAGTVSTGDDDTQKVEVADTERSVSAAAESGRPKSSARVTVSSSGKRPLTTPRSPFSARHAPRENTVMTERKNDLKSLLQHVSSFAMQSNPPAPPPPPRVSHSAAGIRASSAFSLENEPTSDALIRPVLPPLRLPVLPTAVVPPLSAPAVAATVIPAPPSARLSPDNSSRSISSAASSAQSAATTGRSGRTGRTRGGARRGKRRGAAAQSTRDGGAQTDRLQTGLNSRPLPARVTQTLLRRLGPGLDDMEELVDISTQLFGRLNQLSAHMRAVATGTVPPAAVPETAAATGDAVAAAAAANADVLEAALKRAMDAKLTAAQKAHDEQHAAKLNRYRAIAKQLDEDERAERELESKHANDTAARRAEAEKESDRLRTRLEEEMDERTAVWRKEMELDRIRAAASSSLGGGGTNHPLYGLWRDHMLMQAIKTKEATRRLEEANRKKAEATEFGAPNLNFFPSFSNLEHHPMLQSSMGTQELPSASSAATTTAAGANAAAGGAQSAAATGHRSLNVHLHLAPSEVWHQLEPQRMPFVPVPPLLDVDSLPIIDSRPPNDLGLNLLQVDDFDYSYCVEQRATRIRGPAQPSSDEIGPLDSALDKEVAVVMKVKREAEQKARKQAADNKQRRLALEKASANAAALRLNAQRKPPGSADATPSTPRERDRRRTGSRLSGQPLTPSSAAAAAAAAAMAGGASGAMAALLAMGGGVPGAAAAAAAGVSVSIDDSDPTVAGAQSPGVGSPKGGKTPTSKIGFDRKSKEYALMEATFGSIFSPVPAGGPLGSPSRRSSSLDASAHDTTSSRGRRRRASGRHGSSPAVPGVPSVRTPGGGSAPPLPSPVADLLKKSSGGGVGSSVVSVPPSVKPIQEGDEDAAHDAERKREEERHRAEEREIKRLEDETVAFQRFKGTLQSRLHALWRELGMDSERKLLMLSKYIESSHAPKLMNALELWEQASEMIQAREQLLVTYKEFELSRSLDVPSPTTESREESQRAKYQNDLSVWGDKLRDHLNSLATRYDDVVTFFSPRDYREKMRTDLAELMSEVERTRTARSTLLHGNSSTDGTAGALSVIEVEAERKRKAAEAERQRSERHKTAAANALALLQTDELKQKTAAEVASIAGAASTAGGKTKQSIPSLDALRDSIHGLKARVKAVPTSESLHKLIADKERELQLLESAAQQSAAASNADEAKKRSELDAVLLSWKEQKAKHAEEHAKFKERERQHTLAAQQRRADSAGKQEKSIASARESAAVSLAEQRRTIEELAASIQAEHERERDRERSQAEQVERAIAELNAATRRLAIDDETEDETNAAAVSAALAHGSEEMDLWAQLFGGHAIDRHPKPAAGGESKDAPGREPHKKLLRERATGGVSTRQPPKVADAPPSPSHAAGAAAEAGAGSGTTTEAFDPSTERKRAGRGAATDLSVLPPVTAATTAGHSQSRAPDGRDPSAASIAAAEAAEAATSRAAAAALNAATQHYASATTTQSKLSALLDAAKTMTETELQRQHTHRIGAEKAKHAASPAARASAAAGAGSAAPGLIGVNPATGELDEPLLDSALSYLQQRAESPWGFDVKRGTLSVYPTLRPSALSSPPSARSGGAKWGATGASSATGSGGAPPPPLPLLQQPVVTEWWAAKRREIADYNAAARAASTKSAAAVAVASTDGADATATRRVVGSAAASAAAATELEEWADARVRELEADERVWIAKGMLRKQYQQLVVNRLNAIVHTTRMLTDFLNNTNMPKPLHHLPTSSSAVPVSVVPVTFQPKPSVGRIPRPPASGFDGVSLGLGVPTLIALSERRRLEQLIRSQWDHERRTAQRQSDPHVTASGSVEPAPSTTTQRKLKVKKVAFSAVTSTADAAASADAKTEAESDADSDRSPTPPPAPLPHSSVISLLPPRFAGMIVSESMRDDEPAGAGDDADADTKQSGDSGPTITHIGSLTNASGESVERTHLNSRAAASAAPSTHRTHTRTNVSIPIVSAKYLTHVSSATQQPAATGPPPLHPPTEQKRAAPSARSTARTANSEAAPGTQLATASAKLQAHNQKRIGALAGLRSGAVPPPDSTRDDFKLLLPQVVSFAAAHKLQPPLPASNVPLRDDGVSNLFNSTLVPRPLPLPLELVGKPPVRPKTVAPAATAGTVPAGVVLHPPVVVVPSVTPIAGDHKS